jgi:hypothetical protein
LSSEKKEQSKKNRSDLTLPGENAWCNFLFMIASYLVKKFSATEAELLILYKIAVLNCKKLPIKNAVRFYTNGIFNIGTLEFQ